MTTLLILLSNSSEKASLALNLAASSEEKGVNTTVFLVEDGVFVARKGQKEKDNANVLGVQDLIDRGINILAEDVSLKARGISSEKIAKDVKVSTLDELVDITMEKSDRTVWF
ncbi:MAG: DsrE family protein [Candidatus Bathyarchaeota archaeon]